MLGPLVNRPLLLNAASPRLVLLVSPTAHAAANLERQLRRWGLDVRMFATAAQATAWFRVQDAAQLLASIAAVLVDYTPTMRVQASPGGGPFGRASSTRSLTPVSPNGKASPNGDSDASATADLLASKLQVQIDVPNGHGGVGDISHVVVNGGAANANQLAQTIRLCETQTNASSSVPIFYMCNGQLLPEEALSVEDLSLSFVRKPLLLSKLRQLLQSCVVHNTRSPAATPRLPVRKLAEQCPVSILISEDNKVNMKLAVKMLQNMGFRPECAYNGQEACDIIVTRNMHFDIVLMVR